MSLVRFTSKWLVYNRRVIDPLRIDAVVKDTWCQAGRSVRLLNSIGQQLDGLKKKNQSIHFLIRDFSFLQVLEISFFIFRSFVRSPFPFFSSSLLGQVSRVLSFPFCCVCLFVCVCVSHPFVSYLGFIVFYFHDDPFRMNPVLTSRLDEWSRVFQNNSIMPLLNWKT